MEIKVKTIQGVKRPALEHLVGKSNLIGAEIGVGRGINANNIMLSLDIDKLYLIDPYMKYGRGNNVRVTRATRCKNEAHHKLARYEKKIVWIEDTSELSVDKIKNEELDFVYIDGNHFYDQVLKDIILYYPKVKIGGIFGGHNYELNGGRDCQSCNVKKAVDEILKKINTKVCIDNTGCIDWWIIKEKGEL